MLADAMQLTPIPRRGTTSRGAWQCRRRRTEVGDAIRLQIGGPPHEESGSGCAGPKLRRSNLAYGVSGTLSGVRRSGAREMRPR